MQDWLLLDEKYADYLRKFESRIPYTDYGENKFKPFFGKLFEINELVYITQVSHPKPRHLSMRNSLDFKKIFIRGKQPPYSPFLSAVVNLNYMFPVPKGLLKNLQYSNIDQQRSFVNEQEKSRYIDLLQNQLSAINTMDLDVAAMRVYQLKQEYPNHPVSMRCFDFIALEEKALHYAELLIE